VFKLYECFPVLPIDDTQPLDQKAAVRNTCVCYSISHLDRRSAQKLDDAVSGSPPNAAA
jgi:hypothetical protein